MCSAPTPTPPQRKIIHVDMDAFYASVEQRDDPALRGQPIAVGGGGRRGVVATCSYEARKFGVRSAMPGATARRLCPQLIFTRPRFDVYRRVSQQIRDIFAEAADAVQPLSLDEAYLDVTDDRLGLGSATRTAQWIRARILEETGLTASAGVSTNKLIAKLASDENKPDGLTVVPPGQEAAFVQRLSVRRLHGVGPVTAAKLEAMGLHSVAQLAACDRAELAREFKSSTDWLLAMAHGEDDRPVRADRQRKSLSVERTFDFDVSEAAELHHALALTVDTLWDRMSRSDDGPARTLTLKLRLADFSLMTRSITGPAPVTDRETIQTLGTQLLDREIPLAQPVRLMGLGVSGFALREEEALDDLPLFAALP